MDLENIEKEVDKLKAEHKISRHRRIKWVNSKKLRGLPVGLSVLLVASIIVAAALMLYSVKVVDTFNVDCAYTFDDMPAEEYDIVRSFNNVCGGDIVESTHWINASNSIDVNLTLTFAWSGNTSGDGITAEVIYLGGTITELVIEPGNDYEIIIRYSFDPMITADQYECALTITNS